MSLTSCLRKAGTAIKQEDKAAILARARELRADGKKPDDAARQAVDELIAKVRQQLVDAGDVRQTAEAAAPSPASSIEDVGAKIGGARKDRWKERGLAVADLDEMSESEGATLATKANVWKPDYEAMAKATDPVTAAMVKVVYDSLAAKPKADTPQGRRDYVQAMQAVRKVYGSVKTVEEAKNAYQALRQELGVEARQGSRYGDTGDRDARRVLFSLYKGRSDPFVFGYNELARARKLVKDGFPNVDPWKRRLAVRARDGAGVTQAGIDRVVRDSAELGTPLTAEQVKAGYFTVVGVTGGIKSYHPTEADAVAAAQALYERTKGSGSDKAEPERPHLDSLERTGLPKRLDKDVTAKDFMDTFGWRGVEFGNWAAQDERQRLLNMAFDGLTDLAEIIGVPPKALSLNGTMGLAFGARGSGGFAAHYESGKLVINMTKLRGAGSLAHEWAHALDHYLGELDRPDAYQGGARGASGWRTQENYGGTDQRLGNLRPELAAQVDALMKRLYETPMPTAEALDAERAQLERWQAYASRERDPKLKAMYEASVAVSRQRIADLEAGKPSERTRASDFAKEAQKLSGKSGSGYWSRPTEMFARAFESYVFDRLLGMGAKSDYLVHGVEQERFADGTRFKGNPYPVGDERQAIDEAFGKLFDTIKTREGDDGKVAMFSRSGDGARGTVQSVRAALRQRFGDLIDRMEARGFLKIWDTVQAFNEGQGSELIEGAAQGYWDGKVAHLFADGIRPGREVAVLLHEVGEHASMEDMLGPDRYEQLVSRAYDLIEQGDDAATRAMDRIPEDTPDAYRDSELLAYMIEEVATDQAAATPGARKWLADIVAAIRAWWSQTGFNKMLERYGRGIDLTSADIAALAARAVRWQAEQQGGQGGRERASYANVPDSLMGYRKEGPQKGFAETKYPHVEFVRVTWNDGSTMVDAMRGMNKEHALERARRNWRDAEIEAISRQEAEAADPGIGAAVDEGMRTGRLSRPSQAQQQASKVFGPGSPSGMNPDGLESAVRPWDVPEVTAWDNVVRTMQDNKIDLKRVRDSIEERYGRLRDDADAYLHDELYHGRVAARIERLHEESIKPILSKLAVAHKNIGLTLDDLNQYLHARHAPEANAKLREINPGMPGNDALSGMSDAQSAQVLASLRGAGKISALERIAGDVDRLLEDTRTGLVADGLESEDTIRSWEAAYKHYVPLQRDLTGGVGKAQGISVRGPEAKRRTGSHREVVNILANIVSQAETAAIRAEKAEVGRSLLAMAQEYPNPDFWTVDVPPTKPRVNASSGLVERSAVAPNYQVADNVVVVKVYGAEHFIVFNKDNPRAMAMARAMRNLDVQQLPKVIQWMATATRLMASLLTQRSPEFWFTNFARDLQTAGIQMGGTDAEGLQAAALANLPKAMAGMRHVARATGEATAWARHAQDLKDAGGTTGYMRMYEDSDARMKSLQAEVNRMEQGQADPRRLARAMLEFVDDYNDVIENGVRLAVFQAARERGVSTERAASVAKGVTINFNRKGNASTFINALFMFFNAGVQGSAGLARALAKSDKARLIVGTMAAAAFILDIINRSIGGDDDKTKRNHYDSLDDFTKSRNWIFMYPDGSGRHIKIPLPLGFNVFHNVGRLTAEAINRKGSGKHAQDYAWELSKSVLDAFNPLGGFVSIGQFIAPSLVKPLVQVDENKNFAGGPVYRSKEQGFGRDDPRPAYTRHFESTPELWKHASKLLNEVTGGDNVKRGWADVEPDILRHAFTSLTGGLGRSIDRAIDTAQRSSAGKEISPAGLPLVSRFYGEPDDRMRERLYYEMQRRVARAADDVAYFHKEGRSDLVSKVRKDLGDGDEQRGAQLIAAFKAAKKDTKKINAKIRRLERDGIDDSEQADQLTEQRQRRSAVFSRAMSRAAELGAADD